MNSTHRRILNTASAISNEEEPQDEQQQQPQTTSTSPELRQPPQLQSNDDTAKRQPRRASIPVGDSSAKDSPAFPRRSSLKPYTSIPNEGMQRTNSPVVDPPEPFFPPSKPSEPTSPRPSQTSHGTLPSFLSGISLKAKKDKIATSKDLNRSATFSPRSSVSFEKIAGTTKLSFDDEVLEEKYVFFVYKYAMRVWRKVVICLMAALILTLINSVARLPYESSDYEAVLGLRNSTGIPALMAQCPAGLWCSACPFGNSLCVAFDLRSETEWTLLGGILPMVLVLIVTYAFKDETVSRYLHYLSLIASFASAAVFTGLRWMHEGHSYYKYAISFSIFVFGPIVAMNVNFRATTIIIPIALVVSAIPSDAESQNLGGYIAALAALVASGAFTIFLSHEREILLRHRFMQTINYSQHAGKLMEQLTRLRRTYLHQAADFDSPLEKSIAGIRSLLSDPGCTVSQMNILENVLQMLTSSENIMMPDLENQVEGGRVQITLDQEAWLFSELAQRRNRGKSGNRRRSITFATGSEQLGVQDTTTAGVGDSDDVLVPSINTPERSLEFVTASGKMMMRSGSLIAPYFTRKGNVMPLIASMTNLYGEDSKRDADDGRGLFVRGGGGGGSDNASSIVDPRNSGILKGDELVAFLESRKGLPTSQQQQQQQQQQPIVSRKCPLGDRLVQLLDRVEEWDWPIFEFAKECKGKPLGLLSAVLFEKHNFIARFSIPPEKFVNFIIAVENGYNNHLPYHNSTHAADVLHGVSCLSGSPAITKFASDLDMLAAHFAAMIHDLDHPGLNNNFLISAGDRRALLYNDRSVLENHHLACAFGILQNENCNFLAQMNRTDYAQFRELVVELVLATDLTQHFPVVNAFKNKVTVAESFNPAEIREDRTLCWKMIMKCGDVSNPTKQWSLYETWTGRVVQEFFEQGDRERERNLRVSPFMDRHNFSLVANQIGFIDFICVPLYENFGIFAGIGTPLQNLKTNRNTWAARKQEEENAAAAATAAAAAAANISTTQSAQSLLGETKGLKGVSTSTSALSVHKSISALQNSRPATPPPPPPATTTIPITTSSANIRTSISAIDQNR